MTALSSILISVGAWITNVIETLGLWGVFALMVIEGVNVPIPSEAIVPFAGFVASRGGLPFWGVVLAGTLGGTAGALVSYAIGLYGGRAFIRRWGKYVFVHEKDIERGEEYFRRRGASVAFWSRLIPGVRTYISLPAGTLRAPLVPYTLFTLLGAFVWTFVEASVGFWLGERWELVRPVVEQLGVVITAVITLGIVWYIWYHIKKNRESRVMNHGER